MTLLEVQRLLSKNKFMYNRNTIREVVDALGLSFNPFGDSISWSRFIDRLITCFGAQAELSSCADALRFVFSQKGSSINDPRLVARIMAYKNAMADGNSNQKDNGANQSKSDSKASESSDNQTALSGGVSDKPVESSPSADSDNDLNGKEQNSKEVENGCGDTHASDSKLYNDGCSALNCVNDTEESRGDGEDMPISDEAIGKETTYGQQSINDINGDSSSSVYGRISKVMFADLNKAINEAKATTGKGRWAAKLLIQKIKKFSVGNAEQVPLLNKKKLVNEMITKRFNLSKIKGVAKQAKKPCLLMVDVSGSCSAFSHECLVAAMATYLAMPDMITVLWHVNGNYHAHLGHLDTSLMVKLNKGAYWNSNDGVAYWLQDWGLVINFGDMDASYELKAIVGNGSRLLFLDSYSKCAGFRLAVNETKQLIKEWGGDVTKFNGCSDLDDFISALKII